ncbi:hypothetical protein JRQ81_001801 [Phrynocephalus forsythii]|uniref:Centrosomal protein of 70 kDa n=1 Tax=Phrynocephalus forsythii TaxID=171643 RepID=A0A9Q0YB30_9SAUR|nr:hypothetical protein JRQ81_001801 [Phrynocephalus forsythii]
MSGDPWNRDEQEQEEWENINKLLRQHGLRPVFLDNPEDSRNSAEKTLMDKQSSQAIRYALKTLVEETERQRKIVRGLIEDNHQLRDELRLERSRASRQEQRANDLDILLENIKHKICQLEDQSISSASQQHHQVKELQKDHLVIQAKYHQQSEMLREKEETIARLEKELNRRSMEEEEHMAAQKKCSVSFANRLQELPWISRFVV